MESLWKKVCRLVPPDQEERAESLKLIKEYEKNGYLKRLNRELLDMPLPVCADFFRRLSLLHSPSSPVSRRRDSRWMSQLDVSSFHISAASTGIGRGNFIQAAQMLPGLRCTGLLLAPFTETEFNAPNRLLSHSRIDAGLLHPELLKLGLTPEEQLACFVQAAHLCGMVLGFDLSCHLSRDSEALYRRPDMFRWIELDPQQQYIPKGHLSYGQMLDQQNQERINQRIKERVQSLEYRNLDRRECNRQLRREGFFPVPLMQNSPDSEDQGQIPLFIVYDPEKQEAVFTHSSEKQGLTAFRFYKHLGKEREYHQDTLKYFSQIFPIWQKKGFDFLYLDGMLNPFARNPDPEESQQERPDQYILQQVIESARTGSRKAAVIASGHFEHLEDYLELGFSALVDQDDSMRLDQQYMERNLQLQKELKHYNKGKKIKGSMFSRISLAEHNSPSFNQKVHLEHFCCRFMNCGQAGRRKFEMMGINDGSAGYALSLRENRSLIWREDRGFLNQYHILEDIFLRHQNTLQKGEILQARVEHTYAWWLIKGPSELLAAFISVENDEMLPPPLLELDISPFVKSKISPSILEYDFQSTSGNLVLSMTGFIEAAHIPYRGYRLYSIR